jgi:hypothetical protein
VGPVASVVWEDGTRPQVVLRPHPSLGHVADAWFMDGTDLYHVRAFAPHAEWLEAYMREFLLDRFTSADGSHPSPRHDRLCWVRARWSISRAMGVRITRGINVVGFFKRHGFAWEGL